MNKEMTNLYLSRLTHPKYKYMSTLQKVVPISPFLNTLIH